MNKLNYKEPILVTLSTLNLYIGIIEVQNVKYSIITYFERINLDYNIKCEAVVLI